MFLLSDIIIIIIISSSSSSSSSSIVNKQVHNELNVPKSKMPEATIPV